jgi:hypothetical protein
LQVKKEENQDDNEQAKMTPKRQSKKSVAKNEPAEGMEVTKESPPKRTARRVRAKKENLKEIEEAVDADVETKSTRATRTSRKRTAAVEVEQVVEQPKGTTRKRARKEIM